MAVPSGGSGLGIAAQFAKLSKFKQATLFLTAIVVWSIQDAIHEHRLKKDRFYRVRR